MNGTADLLDRAAESGELREQLLDAEFRLQQAHAAVLDALEYAHHDWRCEHQNRWPWENGECGCGLTKLQKEWA